MPSRIRLAFRHHAPLIEVQVGASVPYQQALKALGQPVPPPETVLFAIDTGSGRSFIDISILLRLQLPVRNVAHGFSAQGAPPVSYDEYEASMVLMGQTANSQWRIPALAVLGRSMQSVSATVRGLIGRDVLSQCVMTYDGRSQSFELMY